MTQRTDTITAFVDIGSAYSYIGIHGLGAVARSHGLNIDWRVFELARVRAVIGSPSPFDQPAKLRHNGPDWERSCRDAGLPATPPKSRPVDAGLARRIFYALKIRDASTAGPFLKAVTLQAFGHGRPISTIDDIASSMVGRGLGLDVAAITAALADQRAISHLDMAHEAALEVGAFGAPFFVFRDFRLWGADRLDSLDRLLAEHCDPPAGYKLLDPGRRSLRLLGPVFTRGTPDAALFRFKVTARHLGPDGAVRPAVLTEFCDIACRATAEGNTGAAPAIRLNDTRTRPADDDGAWLDLALDKTGNRTGEVTCNGEPVCTIQVAHRGP